MSLDGWIRLALDAWDYYESSITENIPHSEPIIVPDQPLVVRQPISDKIHSASKDGYCETASYEGCANTKYIDSGGVQTIGIGMTTSEIKDLANWAWNKKIETIDCVAMFLHACKKYEDALNNALHVKVAQYEFDALLSITYNIGIGGMQKSTFMKRLNAGDTKQNIVTAMSWWNQDNGKVVKGLVNRRKKEGDIFLGKGYQSKGKIPYITVNAAHKPVYNSTIDIGQYL